MSRRHLTIAGQASALLGFTLILGLPLNAQEIEEVTVTTRKREENLQEVPIAVSVIGAGTIERQGLSSLEDVTRLVPSLQFQTGFSPQDTQITIRGLSPERGGVNVAVLLDGVDISSSAIETFGGSLLIDPELYDLERIEVVKGPQSALYGRSAFAGAISYVTRSPSDEMEAEVGADVGSDGMFKIKGRVSGPLVEGTLAGAITGMYHTHDGFYKNGETGNDVGGRDGYAFAGDLVWTPSDAVKISGKLSYSDDDFEVQPWAFVDPNVQYPIPQSAIDAGVLLPGFPAADVFGTPPQSVGDLLGQPDIPDFVPGFIPGVGGKFPDSARAGTMSEDPRTCTDPAATTPYATDNSSCDDYPDGFREVTRAQLNIDWDLGPVALTSITHYADADMGQFHDGNATGSQFEQPSTSEPRFETETELLSQELRLSSTGEGRFSWIVGGLYWDEEIDQLSDGNNCFTLLHSFAPTTGGFPPFGLPPLPFLPCGPFMADIGPQGTFPTTVEPWVKDTEHWSAYFWVEIDLSENWILDLEGRYVDEEVVVQGPDGDTIIDPYGLFYNQDLFGAVPDPDTGLLNDCIPWAPVAFPGSFSCINPRPVGLTAAEDGTQDDDFFVPKATLKWIPAENQMYYLSWALAAKPAGVAALTGGPGAFDPARNIYDREEKTTYELGAKTSWADGRFILNGAVFFDDYDEKQVGTQVIDPSTGLLTTRTENASEAEVFGFEIDAVWEATENLLLTAGYTYLDTEFTDFVQITRSYGTIAYGGNCTPITTAAGQTRCGVDFSGNNLENAPEHAFVGSFNYRRPLRGEMDWFLEGDGSFMDERFVAPANVLALDSFWLFNFRAGVSADNWEAVAYVNNAFDDDTVKSGLDNIDPRYVATDASFNVLVPNGARYMLPDPRTYGLRVNYRFGQ
jgi:outer membrane receptor protein involved in Fe transport